MSENPDIDDRLTLEQQVCFALSVADRRIVACYRPLLEPLGLTHPQYLMMIALWQHAPVPMRELGRLLALNSGTLSPLLTRLEIAGLVVREKGPDRRCVTVELTHQGRQLRERARHIPEAVMQHLGMRMTELTALHDRLLALITAATRAPD
jgi:DNA-binding MarR family transcriptional regulator